MCLRGVRKMFDFAKTIAFILSLGLDWMMFNLVPIKFQWIWPFLWQKMALFGPKWPFLAIGGPSKPKWVEHWLNIVEHRQTHPGGEFEPLRLPKSVIRGPLERLKMAYFGPKLAIFKRLKKLSFTYISWIFQRQQVANFHFLRMRSCSKKCPE